MFDFDATCAFGLEAVLGRELKALGLEDVRSDNGHVFFRGDFLAMARANLWARTADRIWLRLGSFPATTFEDVFQGTKALPWADLLPQDAEFPVEGLSHGSQLSSVPALQAVTKKAVVEAMSARYGSQTFPENGPRFPIRVALAKDRATVSLDTSGVGLHKRGYRLLTTEAPIRETLAAGMMLLSYWDAGRLLVDPFCGSGTILLEAAMIGLKRAPGLKREFAAENWPSVGAQVWKEARQEAEDLFDRTSKLRISGSDGDDQAIRHANQNLERSGLDGRGITFRTRELSGLATNTEYGVLVSNPPYGERLSDRTQVEDLYARFGHIVVPWLKTWSAYIITNHPGFVQCFGRNSDKRRKLYNGMIECTLHQYLGPRPPRPQT
ncbi:MAG: class I SAM-dependent RNA methyltransferase [Candidatus Eremiobacteraeota bacterium]|nr:class I SAM-dependent RNA methyltransferase [Candidatus Eremiobacteraeota bacterium]